MTNNYLKVETPNTRQHIKVCIFALTLYTRENSVSEGHLGILTVFQHTPSFSLTRITPVEFLKVGKILADSLQRMVVDVRLKNNWG